MKKPIKISLKVVGKNMYAVIDKKKYTIAVDAETKAKINKEVVAFNKHNTDVGLSRIIKLFTPTETKKKEQKLLAKHQIKHQKKVIKEVKKEVKKDTKNTVEQLKNDLFGDSRFEVTPQGTVRLRGFPIDMPGELVGEIYNFHATKTPLEPLINFWMWAMLNPNPIARTRMFRYIVRHKLIITPSGCFVTYRMVKKTSTPGVYTSARTSKEAYLPGEVFKLNRTECDEDGSRDCSRGLHVGTPNFIGVQLGDGYKKDVNSGKESYGTGYSSPSSDQRLDQTFGNQAIICLVNPMHVVSVPDSDTRKMRVCEFFFCKTTTAEEVVKLQTDKYHIYDHTYEDIRVAELQENLKKAKLENFVDPLKASKAVLKVHDQEKKLEELKNLVKAMGGTNESLTPEMIKKIIQARTQKQLPDGSKGNKG